MQKNNLKFFILAFLTVFTLQVVGAYTSAPSSGPTSNNTIAPMNDSADNNSKYSGLGVKELISGDTGVIAVDVSGNMGVNTSSAPTDVRLEVGGSIKIKDLAGTGTRAICASTTGSANEGYPLVICP